MNCTGKIRFALHVHTGGSLSIFRPTNLRLKKSYLPSKPRSSGSFAQRTEEGRCVEIGRKPR
jgi:hypothetical protein